MNFFLGMTLASTSLDKSTNKSKKIYQAKIRLIGVTEPVDVYQKMPHTGDTNLSTDADSSTAANKL